MGLMVSSVGKTTRDDRDWRAWDEETAGPDVSGMVGKR